MMKEKAEIRLDEIKPDTQVLVEAMVAKRGLDPDGLLWLERVLDGGTTYQLGVDPSTVLLTAPVDAALALAAMMRLEVADREAIRKIIADAVAMASPHSVSTQFLMGLFYRTEAEGEGEECPDCGRRKARNAHDIALGFCPRWYAIRDSEALADCDARAKEREDLSREAPATPPTASEPVEARRIDAPAVDLYREFSVPDDGPVEQAAEEVCPKCGSYQCVMAGECLHATKSTQPPADVRAAFEAWRKDHPGIYGVPIYAAGHAAGRDSRETWTDEPEGPEWPSPGLYDAVVRAIGYKVFVWQDEEVTVFRRCADNPVWATQFKSYQAALDWGVQIIIEPIPDDTPPEPAAVLTAEIKQGVRALVERYTSIFAEHSDNLVDEILAKMEQVLLAAGTLTKSPEAP